MPTYFSFLMTPPAPAVARARPARRYAYLILCGLSFAAAMTVARAEELSVDEMACALDPQCSKPFVDRRLRGVTATPSVRTPGSFDRSVNFGFNSAELTPEARKELDAVAETLKRPNIAKLDIVISGHTDAVGTEDYNLGLSQRRAEAARNYLITQHGIDGRHLIAKGYGKSQLLLPTDPTNELNRRVQFLNPNYAAASAAGSNAPAPVQQAGSPTSDTTAPAADAPASGGEGNGL